jgi:hypothetical protein
VLKGRPLPRAPGTVGRDHTATEAAEIPADGSNASATTDESMRKSRIVVAIPCLNEGPTIGSVVLKGEDARPS